MKKNTLFYTLSLGLAFLGTLSLTSNNAIKVNAEGSHTLTFNYAKGTTDNISLLGIWAGGGEGSLEGNVVDSTASGGYCCKLTQTGTTTYKVFAWANSAKTAFTEANTYAVYFKYKTDANDPLTSMSFEWEGDWLIKGSVTDATTEWKEAYFTFTITDTAKLGNGTCLFDLGGKGTMYVDDFSCIPTVKTYNEGDAIGELPAFYNYQNKENGYWSVDGEEITSSSTFSWSEDKEATISYPESQYKVTYRYESPISLTSKLDYWHDGGGCTLPTISEDEITLSRTTSNLTYRCYDSNETALAVGNNYEISFDMKTSGNVYLSLQYNIDSAWKAEILNGWKDLSEYTRQTINLTSDASGLLLLDFHFNAGDNQTITLKNLKVTKIVENSVVPGDAIGTLPEGTSHSGYEFKGWYLNETKIDSTYVPTGSVSLTSQYEKLKSTYKVTYHKYNEAHRQNIATTHKWYKQNNVSSSLTQDDEKLVITGENTLMYRTMLDNIVEGQKYHLEMKIQTGTSKVHLVINNDWSSTLKTFVQKETLSSYSYDFVAPALSGGKSFFDIQIAYIGSGSEGTVIVEDFYIHEIEEYSFLEGTNLSDIPTAEAGAKWVSNTGDELTVSTVVNSDITAYLTPSVVVNFPTDHRLDHQIMTTFEGFDYYSDKPLVASYSWLVSKTSTTSKDTLSEEDVGKNLYQKVVITDAFNRTSVTAISESMQILAKDTNAPKFYMNNSEFNKTELTIKVNKNTYLFNNLTALDEIDGKLDIKINDTNNVMNCLNRLVNSGDLLLTATDLTGNVATITIHVSII